MDKYIVVDIESTGVKLSEDEIIEIGAVYIEEGVLKDKFNMLIKPTTPISQNITNITGITNEMVRYSYSIDIVLPKFIEFTRNCPLVGHNINIFDYRLLKIHANRLKLAFNHELVDTLVISRKVLDMLPSRKLGDLCEFYKIRLVNAHRAYDDAYATYELFVKLKQEFGATNPELFIPQKIEFKPPKIEPITLKQVAYLESLCKKYNILPEKDIATMSKSEGSRNIDKIISQYGR
ncbi:MAG: hypothetical protein BEN18_02350 [Epulopiscium sp. Nuni2H_MBin001]|nr:MAG: hypothetical protein BEN18_02350 [Epulopiscium sp. Nuni2H_MBin001]